MSNGNSKHSENSSKRNLLLGATGVAVVAGVVAAGVALSNRKTREKVGKSLQKGFKTAGEIAGSRYDMGDKGGAAVKSKTSKTKSARKKSKLPEHKVAAHSISVKPSIKKGRPPEKRASP